MTVKASELASRFIQEVVQLHGLPKTIVSDRDAKFTSTFWRELHRMLRAKLLMSATLHPQTDGTSERAIRNAIQILRAMVRPDHKDWVTKLPMTEFALNSSISSLTGFTSFELNYKYMPVLMQHIKEGKPSIALGIRTFVQQAIQNIEMVHDAIIESQVTQVSHANEKQSEGRSIQIGDLMYLSMTNLTMPRE